MTGLDPRFADLAQAYGGLSRSLAAIKPADERAVARNAVRDALDRSAAGLDTAPTLVADTFWVEGVAHTGNPFEILKLRHRDLGTSHALKTIARERAAPHWRDMLMREGAHHLRVAPHPAVLPARAVLRLPDGRPALLLDWSDGVTLADHLAAAAIPETAVMALLHRLCGALDAVHAAGLVHADVSPNNILLDKTNCADAVLIDFGLSVPEGEEHSAYGLAEAATHAFSSPEQRRGMVALDRRADLFSLGKIARMLTTPSNDGPLTRWADILCAQEPDDRPNDVSSALRLLEKLRYG